jgi:hypothetical protein
MEEHHVHHDHYASLPDFESRLMASILGLPDSSVEFPDISARFAPYLGWLDQTSVMKIHFEDFVDDRTLTLNRILDHFLTRVPLQKPRQLIIDSLESSINPAKSPTFRSGRTSEWKKYFTKRHKDIFKSVAGDLLVRLEYERNNDW